MTVERYEIDLGMVEVPVLMPGQGELPFETTETTETDKEGEA